MVLPERTIPSAPPSGVYPSIFINLWFLPVQCVRWGHLGASDRGKKQRWPVSHSLPMRVRRQILAHSVLSTGALPFTLPTSPKGAMVLLGVQGQCLFGISGNF